MKATLLVVLMILPLSAAVFHVDPENGKAGNTGLSLESALPTVREALALCLGKEADEIKVKPGVFPLREEIMFAGKQYSREKPLILDLGNRWVTGTEPIPTEVWNQEGAGLWKATGFCAKYPFSFLIINGRAERMGRGRLWANEKLPPREALSPYQWTREGDDLILCLPKDRDVSQVGVERAARATGISMMGGTRNSDVWVRNARVKFCTNDGINLHGPREGRVTEGIRFENVRSDWNWDQGISSHDGCESVIEDAVMIGNIAGLVHIDSSKTTHRRLLLAEGGRFDLFFYGQCQAVFEECYVYSSMAERHLRYREKEWRSNAAFIFSNSVFHAGATNAKPWQFVLGGIKFRFDESTLWMDQGFPLQPETADVETEGLFRNSIVRSGQGGFAMAWGPKAQVRFERTLFDKVGVKLGSGAFQDGPALRGSGFADAQSGFCKRLDASPFPGAARLEGKGAQFSPAMAERVRQYHTRELLGGGFALLSKTRKDSVVSLRFNRVVDPLSLRGGILAWREGKAICPECIQTLRGDELEIRGIKEGDRLLLTTELRSELGPDGLRSEIGL